MSEFRSAAWRRQFAEAPDAEYRCRNQSGEFRMDRALFFALLQRATSLIEFMLWCILYDSGFGQADKPEWTPLDEAEMMRATRATRNGAAKAMRGLETAGLVERRRSARKGHRWEYRALPERIGAGPLRERRRLKPKADRKCAPAAPAAALKASSCTGSPDCPNFRGAHPAAPDPMAPILADLRALGIPASAADAQCTLQLASEALPVTEQCTLELALPANGENQVAAGECTLQLAFDPAPSCIPELASRDTQVEDSTPISLLPEAVVSNESGRLTAPRKNLPPAPPEKPNTKTSAPEPIGLTAQLTESLLYEVRRMQTAYPGKWSDPPVTLENAGDCALAQKLARKLATVEGLVGFCWFCAGKLKRGRPPECVGLLDLWCDDFLRERRG